MPHVTVKLRSGRSEEERMACARAVAAAIAETLENVENEPMIVSVMETPGEEWDEVSGTVFKQVNAGNVSGDV